MPRRDWCNGLLNKDSVSGYSELNLWKYCLQYSCRWYASIPHCTSFMTPHTLPRWFGISQNTKRCILKASQDFPFLWDMRFTFRPLLKNKPRALAQRCHPGRQLGWSHSITMPSGAMSLGQVCLLHLQDGDAACAALPGQTALARVCRVYNQKAGGLQVCFAFEWGGGRSSEL